MRRQPFSTAIPNFPGHIPKLHMHLETEACSNQHLPPYIPPLTPSFSPQGAEWDSGMPLVWQTTAAPVCQHQAQVRISRACAAQPGLELCQDTSSHSKTLGTAPHEQGLDVKPGRTPLLTALPAWVGCRPCPEQGLGVNLVLGSGQWHLQS